MERAEPSVIRLATPADIGGIFAIYDEEVLHGTATAQTVPFTAEEREAWFARHTPDLHPLVAAVEADGFVAGWAGLSPWSPRQAYRRSAENSVYVARSRHGRGLGRALMRELLARTLRDTPVRLVIARPTERNVASIRLHESLGFQTVGVLRHVMEKFGELQDVRILSLDLDARTP
ncbi:MAG: GNAT family N-acetyltransferase [Planctomycetota bacterium]|nr:GNAT family N-acetyltransferase [Planctomycetota bacterium]